MFRKKIENHDSVYVIILAFDLHSLLCHSVGGKGITFLQAQLFQHNFPTFQMNCDKQCSNYIVPVYGLFSLYIPFIYFLLPTNNTTTTTICNFLPLLE